MPVLDGIRGLAVLAVMLLHYEVREWPWRHGLMAPVWLFINLGWLGVNLFFALSGFLITGILLDTRGRADYWKNFVVRRALRIFPLYYLSLIVIFVVIPQFMPATLPAPGVGTQLWFWSYVSNFLLTQHGWAASPRLAAHFWSLAVEEQFYLFWPLVVMLCPPRQLARVCVVLAGGALAFRLLVFGSDVDGMREYVLLPARLDQLALGALGAIALRSRYADLARRLVPAAIVLLGLAALAVEARQGWGNHTDFIVGTVGTSIWAAFFGALVFGGAVAKPRSVLAQTLGRGWLRFVGRYSYGIYVWHYPILIVLTASGLTIASMVQALHSTALGHAGFIGINLVLTLTVSLASWYVLEAPMLRLKRYFPTRAGAEPGARLPASGRPQTAP